MRALKAVVQNGRLIVDEPTELPDGEVVYLHPIELSVGEDDGFTEAERAALHRALDEGIAAQRRGDLEEENRPEPHAGPIGLFADEPELVESICDEAVIARERGPLRTS